MKARKKPIETVLLGTTEGKKKDRMRWLMIAKSHITPPQTLPSHRPTAAIGSMTAN
jgi:hypothetical protein